jgi:aminoglycoside phosphotransferase (APT) family kinase protein
VARTHPDQVQLFRDPDFRKQYTVIDALHRSGRVRVAEPLFFEDDPAALGVPFFVMSQLRGRVPVTSPPYNSAGFLFDATPAERRVAWETAFDELCRIAAVPVEEFAFLDQPHLGPTPLEQQLAYWRDSTDWSTGGRTPDAVWALYEWLATHLPEDRTPGFTWGDARIGNMMFGDDFRLVGVMDWEQANLSGIRQDLGWWLFFDDFHASARGLTRLDGLGTREESLARWEDRVGEPAGDLTWYEVFTGYQITLLTIRTMLTLDAPGALDLGTNLGYRIARDRLGW